MMKSWNVRLRPFLAFVALLSVGCSGINFGEGDPTPIDLEETPPPDTGEELKVDLTAGPVYLAFDDESPLSISDPDASLDWDMRAEGAALNLNGGEAGPGESWGFGPVGEGVEDYEALTDHDDTYIAFEFSDEFESVMADWYKYIVSGDAHGIYSRYHVYAVDVPGAGVFKLQVLNYYGDVNGSPESGIITLRSAGIDSTSPIETVVDARAGGSHAAEDDPANKYTYLKLTEGGPVVIDLTDEAAASSSDWHVAFKRYYVKLNGGVSGPLGVKGYDFQAGRSESNDELIHYDPEAALSDFTAASSSGLDGVTWTTDGIGSILEDAYAYDEAGTLTVSNYVFVVVDASGDDYYKLLVTGVDLDAQGQPTAMYYRVAPIN